MKIADIAKVCHEAVRAYCETLDGTPHATWESASKEQHASTILGVEFVRDNPGAGQSAQHDAWLAHKAAEGWKVGPVKDVDKKEHPCFVLYGQLPEDQKAKDALFQGVARALIPYLTA